MIHSDTRQTEMVIGRVLAVGTRVSTTCLALGLVLRFVLPQVWITRWLLTTGLVVLLATPAARVAVSIEEFARRREWPFVVYASLVFTLLLGSLLFAIR
jgi:uncharacterized membrane protein